jgi:hypothetical protein
MTMPDTRGGGRENAGVGTEQALPGTGTEGSGAGTGSGAREQVRQAKDKVVDQAKSTFRDARQKAGSAFSENRFKAADQIGGIGSAFRRTGEQLRGEDRARIADMTDSVARQIDRVADYLRTADGRTMTRDFENIARRQPAAVFAGAFALGVLAARFLKSSAPDYQDEDVASYERVHAGGEPAGLGSGFDRETGYGTETGYGESGYGRRPGYGGESALDRESELDREPGFGREAGGFNDRA